MAQSKVPLDPNMPKEVRTFLDGIVKDLASITTAQIGAAGTTQTEYLSGYFAGPLNQDYRIIERIPYGMTFAGFTGKTSSGTLTATLKINSTAITDGALNVTLTQGSVTPSAANVAAEGDALVITVSAISSPRDFSWTIEYTRTLEN